MALSLETESKYTTATALPRHSHGQEGGSRTATAYATHQARRAVCAWPGPDVIRGVRPWDAGYGVQVRLSQATAALSEEALAQTVQGRTMQRVGVHAPGLPPPGVATLVEVLQYRAAWQPETLAFRFLLDGEEAEASLTYAELDRQARAVAARLQETVPSGQPVLLLYPPGLDYIVSVFGCWYAGMVAVPAYPPRMSRHMSRLQAVAVDARAPLALTTSTMYARIAQQIAAEPALQTLQWLATDGTADAADAWRRPELTGDALAILQYTSGSTSAPKGVMLSHANLMHNLAALTSLADRTPVTACVTWLPPYHDMGLIGMLLLPVYYGIETTMMSPWAFLQRPVRWLQALTRYRAQLSGGPNFAYELCVRRIRREQKQTLELSHWQIAFNGAERVWPATLERFATAFAPCGFRRVALSPCYGLAEATLGVTFTPPEIPPVIRPHAPVRPLASSGRVLPGQELCIVDPDLCTPCAPGQVGEIWVAGTSVAQGYWRQPRLTTQTFRTRLAGEAQGRWLRTGDLGCVVDGELFVTGRLKELIIIAGKNYYPEDIERVAQEAHPALRPDCSAAFAVESETHERLVIAQEVHQSHALEVGEIAGAVREAIAQAFDLQVHTLLLLPPGRLPKTSSGKIQRQECRSQWQHGALELLGSDVPGAGPWPLAPAATTLTPFQKRLVQIMGAVLEVAHPGMDENFFDLGGQSILATQLVSRLREALGIDVPLRLVFEAPTVADFARSVEAEWHRHLEAPPVQPVPREGELPLTFSQERMWFLHHLEPESAAYNVTGALSLEGPLRCPALQEAMREIIRRHEILRANYVMVDGRPSQVIRPALALPLSPLDLTAYADPDAEAQARATLLASTPFDLAAEPLLRVCLYQLAQERYVLAFSAHHMITDAWSLGIMLRELAQLYEAYAAGHDSPLPEPVIQYIDYAHWQRQWLQGKRLRPQRDYWRRQLANLPPRLQLPTDRPWTAKQSARGALHQLELPDELLQALQELGRRHHATLFMVFLAAFQALLSRYSGQTDIAVGVPIANRNWLAAEGVVGTLVNTLIIRTDLSQDPSFTELLQRVKQVALSAYTNQDLPLEQLIDALQPERTLHQMPLFQVMFDYQSLPVPPQRIAGVCMRPFLTSRGAAQFDLSLFVLDTGFTHMLSVEYSTDVFEAATVTRMMAHFVALLQSIVMAEERPLLALPLLKDAERGQMLLAWNDTRMPRPATATFGGEFARQVAATPDAVAVICDGQHVTYRQLNARANQLGHALRSLGVGAEVRVGLYIERSLDLLVALLGTLKAGGAYVPLDPTSPPDRLSLILEDARLRVVVTQKGLWQQLPAGIDATILCLDGLRAWLAVHPTANLSLETAPESLAYVIFTSGSTGRPKGVQITHGALANFLLAMVLQPGMHATDSMLAVTTVAFDIAALELLLPLMTGARVEIVSHDVAHDGLRLRDHLKASPCTVMQATPATWRMLIAAGWVGTPHLTVLCGGEALPRDLAEQLLERSAVVWNLYGPTEATVWATRQRVQRGEDPVPLGHPLPNTEIYLLDDMLEPVPVGVMGEVYLGGEGLARGYLNQPELTAAKFLPHPFSAAPGARLYKTGDSARYVPENGIEFLGRLDQQVKLRGFRIELGEIEVVLRRHTGVQEAVVVAWEEAPGDKRLVAYVVLHQGQAQTVSDLRRFLHTALPGYMVPSAFVLLDALPLTPNGKVDRGALPPPDLSHPHVETEFLAPRTSAEALLAGIWAEVLKIARVGVYENFFAIGGDSIRSLQVVARANQAGLRLTPRQLFQYPTIAALATVADMTPPVQVTPALPTALPQGRSSDTGGYPLCSFPLAGLDQISLEELAGQEADIEDIYPLAALQEGMLFHSLYAPASGVYLTQITGTVSGLHVADLVRAWQQVMERHPALRTAFVWQHLEQPLQVVRQRLSLPWASYDWRGLSAFEQQEHLEAYLTSDRRRGFQLSQAPLMRLALMQVAEDTYHFVWTHHHMLLDGWSVHLLLKEILAFYAALRQGQALHMERSRPYRDYVAWLQQQDLRPAAVFWQEFLKGFRVPTPPGIPGQVGGGAPMQAQSDGLRHGIVPADTMSAARALARCYGFTLHTLVLGVWAILLSHYSGADDVLFGTTVAVRPPDVSGAEVMVGLCINTLPMRLHVAHTALLLPWLQALQERHAELRQYAYSPLVQIHGWSEVPRTLPLFESLVVFENYPVEAFPALQGPDTALTLQQFACLTRNSLPCTVRVVPGPQLELQILYDTRRFDTAAIDRMAAHFIALLHEMVTQPERRLAELSDTLIGVDNTYRDQQARAFEESRRQKLQHVRRRAARGTQMEGKDRS